MILLMSPHTNLLIKKLLSQCTSSISDLTRGNFSTVKDWDIKQEQNKASELWLSSNTRVVSFSEKH